MATKTEQLLAYLQTPGLSDAAIANEINRIGISAQEVSALTGVPADTVQQRITAATPVATTTRPTFATQAETGLYDYLQTPGLTDAQIAAEVNRLGLNAEQISSMTGVPVGQVQSRLAPFAPKVTTPIVTTPVVTTPVTTSNYDVFANWLKTTPNLTDTQIAAEMNRLGITTGQVGQITGMPGTDIENRFRATTPFAGATQGFAQNFNNYQSIPIGSQYNPFAVGGTGSPYAQIMGQMRPVGNPYQNVVGNLPMGGYNPGLYDQIAAANAARAAAAAAGNTAVDLSGGGGDSDDGPGPGDGQGPGAGEGGGGATGDCVDPDVHILLADRSTVRAGDLKVGDMLHTLHDETFVYGDFPVEYVNVLQRPKVEALFDDGQKIIISITHKFLTADNKWEKISDIEIGTSIRGFEDVTKKLVSITNVGTGPVIEMVVTDAHTYISEGLVSHNKFYGGLITNVSGPDPAGPDEGQVNMMRGEYVIKKSSVNKYGKGLLDMINEGKVPAKKMKSLLG
jgi:hypothetical protein